MKRICSFIILVAVYVFSVGTVCAMQFSQPEKVGSIGYANMGGFYVEDSAYYNGNGAHLGLGHHTVYDTGIARYSDGADALYFHYGAEKVSLNGHSYNKGYSKFGAKDINNTVSVPVMSPILFKIKSNENITLYVVMDSYDLPEENRYHIIGRRSDGKWVKYIDTDDIVKNYFGSRGYDLGALAVDNDTLRIFYRTYDYQNMSNLASTSKGELRFKWDENAQWFGVEKIVYNPMDKKAEKCVPPEAVEYKGHYYYLYDSTSESWRGAKDFCEQMGGHLATIADADENKFLYDYMISRGYKSAYFGLTDEKSFNNWQWVTGEPVRYTNWHPGEPSHSKNQEHYGMFYWKFKYTWNDGDFWGWVTDGNVRAFICEWDGKY